MMINTIITFLYGQKNGLLSMTDKEDIKKKEEDIKGKTAYATEAFLLPSVFFPIINSPMVSSSELCPYPNLPTTL